MIYIYPGHKGLNTMKKLLGAGDAAAISLSLLCAIHCLVLPLILVLVPTLASSLTDENFHRWMVIAVVPVSLFSLVMGWKRHKRYFAIMAGSAGLLLLIFTGYFSANILNEIWEENLTLLAALIIAVGHFFNFQFCQKTCRSREAVPGDF